MYNVTASAGFPGSRSRHIVFYVFLCFIFLVKTYLGCYYIIETI